MRKRIVTTVEMITFIITGLLVVTMLSGSIFQHEEGMGYESGVILVEFKPNVTLENATEIIESYNCTVINWLGTEAGNGLLTAKVGVPVGQEKEYVELFRENNAVYAAQLNKKIT